MLGCSLPVKFPTKYSGRERKEGRGKEGGRGGGGCRKEYNYNTDRTGYLQLTQVKYN